MLGVITLLCGMAIGGALTLAIQATARTLALRPRHPALPPATARKLARAARRNRADLRLVMRPLVDMRPAREVGVRVRAGDEAYAFRDGPPRLERLAEPPTFLPSLYALDNEDTHNGR